MARKRKRKGASAPARIAYEGKVSVRVERGGKTVRSYGSRNAAKADLLKFMADCLAGTYNQSNRPVYVAALRLADAGGDRSEDNLSPLSPFPVPLGTVNVSSGRDEGGFPYATASMSFVVSGLSIGSASVSAFALYASANASGYGASGYGSPSAITILPAGEDIDVGNGENLVVTWDLTISNVEKASA